MAGHAPAHHWLPRCLSGSHGRNLAPAVGPEPSDEPIELTAAAMADHHFEPSVYLVDVAHEAALIAWGGFWFWPASTGRPDQAVIVDDEDLGEVSPGRSETIGARSRTYGQAVAQALDAD